MNKLILYFKSVLKFPIFEIRLNIKEYKDE